jgi:hypothetical protein
VAKKKQRSGAESAEKQLKGAVKKLKAQLAAAEKSAEKWKARAKEQQSKAAGTKSELTAARRRLAKAEARAAKWKDRARAVPPVVAPAPPPAVAGRSTTPDDTWTVTALRAEARTRGLPGYSRKTKVQLLAELSS